MYSSRIVGLGHYVPDNIVTNDDLSKLMDTNDEWITERTGIKERRLIKKDSGEGTATMGVKAAEMALESAGISKNDIDLVVFATLSPDLYFPGSGVLLQDQMGMGTCPALDIRNQCSGFVYGLSVADQFIKTGMYKNVLLVGSEYHSGGMDFTTRGRTVSVIFGDGAGAAVLTREEDTKKGIQSTHLYSEGKYAEELAIIGPSTKRWLPDIISDYDEDDMRYHPYMNGQLVFKNAVVRFSEVMQEALQKNGKNTSDIDLFIPHQANLRIAQFVQKKFSLRDDQVYNNIMRYGNTTAASIPIALSEAWGEGKIKTDDTVLLAAFGSGFTWGSALIQW
ncbi:MAG: 3-oxoacyl-[acyl-carrier-protein] synthase 3 [Flavobacteriales bacterium]|nr:MAG: 3-oxoacyl-[acyl-carrier-protein] synthase 3 [Flavobacteriales bacterium]